MRDGFSHVGHCFSETSDARLVHLGTSHVSQRRPGPLLSTAEPLVLKRARPWGPRGSRIHTVPAFLVSFSVFFLGLHLRHLEVPRPGVKSEMQLLAYATATATWDLSRICDRHGSLRQRQILNPRSEARDGTHILTENAISGS